MEHQGLVHIYCGDGKGKTTAAFGLALRCAGYGQRVLVVQFLKGWDSGELRAASRMPEITLLRGDASSKFVFQMDEGEKSAVQAQHDANLREAMACIAQGGYRMLVLDEIMAAWNCGVIDRGLVLELLRDRPADVEIVMTGQNPPPELYGQAHYISEICKRRHPYDRGTDARQFIEF